MEGQGALRAPPREGVEGRWGRDLGGFRGSSRVCGWARVGLGA